MRTRAPLGSHYSSSRIICIYHCKASSRSQIPFILITPQPMEIYLLLPHCSSQGAQDLQLPSTMATGHVDGIPRSDLSCALLALLPCWLRLCGSSASHRDVRVPTPLPRPLLSPFLSAQCSPAPISVNNSLLLPASPF